VESSVRGKFSSAEASLQNVFELLGYATTLVFADPAQFRYPALISTISVLVGGTLYAWFVRKRRGHLLHVDLCGRKEPDTMDGVPLMSLR
jgi:iron-regulated transporter 1